MNVRAAIADRRIRAAAGALAAVLVALVVVLVATGGSSSSSPPANDAAKLVPADALVYLHLSTDTGRDATKRALALARRFPSFERVSSALAARLQDPSCGTDLKRLGGREAALALLNTSTSTAGSLVLVDTGSEHLGAATKSCGTVSRTFIGRFLAIGQPDSLAAARALAKAGPGARSLASQPDYRKATGALPADRVADAWASRDGVRRLLAPQGGLLGAAGVLLDQPALKGVAAGLEARDKSARLVVHSVLDPKQRGKGTFPLFEPTLAGQAPPDALAYLGVSGLKTALSRILAATGPGATGLGQLLQRAGRQLDQQSGGRLTKQVLDVLQGEVGLSLTSAIPAPVLTIVAHAKPGTAQALAQLEGPIARLLGKKARFRVQDVEGRQAHVLRLGPLQIAYAVLGDQLVISTSTSGIAAAARGGDHLAGSDTFKTVAGDTPDRVSSVLFLDFTELLRLGEQTGLGDSRAYQAVRDDLQKVRAVGAWSSGDDDESTAEINLSIP